jgi:hypothetical protein
LFSAINQTWLRFHPIQNLKPLIRADKLGHQMMARRREIDERDIDTLLAALTDLQIADLYGIALAEVSEIRQSRQPKPPSARQKPKKDGEAKN